ncbi:MAG: YraN family protein [Lachnospiraceae bacterium]|nr:YraN family protein [Lachnospiraceae bacterium]
MGEKRNTQNSRAVGKRYEELAASYLERQGMKIIERNFRTRNGEIDLVGRDGTYLVFIEVKFRKSGVSGSGAEAVHARKQRTICRISDYYRIRYRIPPSTPVRYDVVECGIDERGEITVTWYRHAFLYRT